MRLTPFFLLLLIASFPACSAQSEDNPPVKKEANVTAVEVQGDTGAYAFQVTVRSPDTGCEQYANWWEVVSPEGDTLIYRRILAHPHVNEQPFTRSGGPVSIAPDSTVVVRAHMNNTGYGGQAMRGTVANGFSKTDLPEDFGAAIDEASPACGF